MARGARLALIVLFAAHAAVAASPSRIRAELINNGIAVTADETIRPKGAVVEFHAPRAAASGQRAARAAVLAQFRADLERIAAIPAAKIRHEYSAVFFGVAVDARPESLTALRALDYVRAVHADRAVRAYASGEPIDARPRVGAQSFAGGGAGIVVAVIDTGIDYTHPALGGGFGPAFKVIGGHDFVNDDDDPMDDQGHGTHVAGTAAANAPDLIGVAPEARLLAYKVLDASGFGSTSDIIAAMERSVDPNGDGDRSDAADVINMSLGGGGTAEDPLSRAADNAVAAGIVVVVAAGNAGATASIGAPGAADSVITVGAVDGAGVIAPFSSRGPTSKLLTFKPEIMAPGVAILSSIPGGGIASANGTSMATPHVAGVAALLRQLHPDWTPAMVKAAIIAGAVSMPGTGFARGAGRIDAVRAANASVVLSVAGLSFGLAHQTSGSTTQSGTVTVTNLSASQETFSATTPPGPQGVVVSVDPSRVELAAGASATVTVSLAIDNQLAAFPEEPSVGGDIRFNNVRGTSSFAIPWAMLRAARATVTYDAFASHLAVLAPADSGDETAYGSGVWELFVKPGTAWDFILIGEDYEEGATDPYAIRYLVAEKQPISGDVTVAFRAADASLRFTYAAQDAQGRLLSELPEFGEVRRRVTATRLHLADGDWLFASMVQTWGGRDIYITPVSDRYTLIPYESHLDVVSMRGYNVQHSAIRAPSASAVLEARPSAYIHARLLWEQPRAAAELFVACSAGAVSNARFFSFGTGACVGREMEGPLAFEYYTSADTSAEAFSGLVFQAGSSTTATFRGVENAIVASSEAKPGRTAPRIPHGSDVSVGSGVFFPFAFYGTTAGLPVLWPSANFFGPYGETLRNDTVPARWETFDATGTRTSGGTIEPYGGRIPQGALNGSRLVVKREWRHESGLTSSGTLEVAFAAAGTDLTAPTVTSMQVADAAGRPTSRLAVGTAGTLRFSAGDLDHGKRMELQPMKSGGTRALWRRAGAGAWEPLALALVETESGSTTTLGHVPAGDIWTAGLGAATAAPGLVDLRIELEDLAGNTMTWTQEGALFIGGESGDGSRARRVRRP